MSIENTLHSFVRSRDAGAVVIQGAWGTGKTYFWNRRIVEPFTTDNRFRIRSRAYAYVSLFGIDSLADLKTAIHHSILENQAKLSRWRRLWHRASQGIPLLGSASEPYSGQVVAKAYDALAYFTIKNCLICLDDLERRGSGLALRDVLGLVSHLVEQRKCRVVVILNVDAFADGEDRATWNSYREKVFSGEMTYESTPENSVRLAMEDNTHQPWHGRATQLMHQLGVSNIRVAHRIKRSLEQAIGAVSGNQLRPETMDHIIKSVVLFAYCHVGESEGAPPMDMVRREPPFDISFFMREKKERSAKEDAWSTTLNDYGHYYGDPLDQALDDMVTSGFPDVERLSGAAQLYDSQAKQHANKEAWNNAWRLYHDTLANNADELAAELERTWPPVSHVEHVRNLDSLVGLLRTLGRPEVASNFIKTWVAQRATVNIETLAPREVYTFGPVKDEELQEAIHRAYTAARPLPPLSEALRAMSHRDTFDEQAIAAIAVSTPSALAKHLLDNPHVEGQDKAISAIVQFKEQGNSRNGQRASEVMRDALLIIAAQSSFQADRIQRKYGVSPQDDNHGDPSRRETANARSAGAE